MLTGIFRDLLRDESGATAIEYGLLLSLLVVMLVAALDSIGGSLVQTFESASNSLK